MSEITGRFVQTSDDKPSATSALMASVYEFHGLAGPDMRREEDHTLQSTALVHEAYLRPAGGTAGKNRWLHGEIAGRQ